MSLRIFYSPRIIPLLSSSPKGLRWVDDVHMIHHIGDLGIVFFLFEMGLELSLERLRAMKKDVFGLGTSQFVVTSAVGTLLCMLCGLTAPQGMAVGGSLALSSSAFVLQLLKDKDAMGDLRPLLHIYSIHHSYLCQNHRP